MNQLVQQFRAACLPFVTRTFRGQRWRRTLMLSAVLAVITALSGLWLAQGDGPFEHDVRRELGLERSTYEREEAEFKVITRESWHYESLLDERQELIRTGIDLRPEYGQLNYKVEQGMNTLLAADTVRAPAEFRDLEQRASALLASHPPRLADEDYRMRGFSWRNERDVERLRHIVDQRLIPDVERYESPLTAMGTVRFIGLVGGGFFATLLLLAAPLLAGVQIAQEVHENTLQPVTGTSLSPRELVVGLTSGPLAQIGVLALPQLALVVGAAAIAGALIPALGFVVLATIVGLFFSMLTQLIGFGAGRRRAPGLIAVGLLALLGSALLGGTGIGFNLDDEFLGLVTIVPQSGVAHLLRETFVPARELSLSAAFDVDIRLAFAAVAFAIFVGVAHLALERRVARRTSVSLRATEAWVAVGTLIIAALLAMPDFGSTRHDGIATYFLSLGMLVVPFQLILMGRVTIGDAPAALRTVPIQRLLGEYAAYLTAHLAITLVVIGGPQELFPLSFAGLIHTGWALSIAALLAIRAVGVPLKPAGAVWAAVCLVLAVIEFGMGVALNAEAHRSSYDQLEHILPLFEVSAVLGIFQLGLMVWVPISLVRALRNNSAKPR